MSIFSIHTPESAPEASRAILDGARRGYGFVPNLLGGLAEAPATLEGYVALSRILDKASFTETEKQVVLIATSLENGCDYCVAAHATAARLKRVPDDVVAVVAGRPIADPRLEALRQFTLALVRERGRVADEAVQVFLAAGFERAQALEVVLGVALKTIANYANHLIGTPIDAAFAPAARPAREAS